MNSNLLLRIAQTIVIFLSLGSSVMNAQTSYALGFETGTLHDRSHFRYQDQSLTGAGFGGYLKVNLELEHKGFAYVLGFGRYRHAHRLFELNRESGTIEKPRQSYTDMESYVIPLTVYKAFEIADKWDARVGLGVIGLFPRESGDLFSALTFNTTTDSTGLEVEQPDSTIMVWGTDRQFNFAFETSVRIVYKTYGPLSFYASFAFQAHLMPVMEADITFYDEGGTFTRGNSTAVNSYTFGIGASYRFQRNSNNLRDTD